MFQKQAFADVVQNRCSYKFRNIHGCFPVNIEKILRLAFFYRTPPKAVSDVLFLVACL